eukprot:CAMPEP_0181324912 /NCGR_PEP_ID=MMETSP1101-20121128/20629_1 /TAXON_ID=46948 /ORGANISM="Rhodomonas abbreviata, Strain Caron Lab Isolate" /LENGTH=231 /DNA_ID=CAMNT_0023433153 /DNA_START=158 /DNA_END=850 /DNA_ORIENTATION=+
MESKATDLRLVQDVVRMVARSFYEPEAVVVLDGLLYLTGEERPSIKDEDLATELSLQHKVVRGVLGRLERECLVKSFERKETKGVKEIQQQYWRIDYKLFLDAVKLRIHKMKSGLHSAAVENVTLYVCETCEDEEGRHPSWDEYEVQEVLNNELQIFECPYCENELQAQSGNKSDEGPADIHPRLQKQLKRLIEALNRTEEITLPAPRPESMMLPPKTGPVKGGGDGANGG